MNGIFQSFSSEDMLKSHNRDLMAKVAGIWDRCVAPESDYVGRRAVLLVDVGDWLYQSSWHDETGYFLKFRMAPLDCHRLDTQERARRVLKAFMGLFPGHTASTTYDEEVLSNGGTGTVTVVVKTGRHSIGD